MKVGSIIMVVFFLVALLGGIGGTSYHYIKSVEAMNEQVFKHLESVAQSRASHIETLLDTYKENVKMISTGNAFKDSVDESIDYEKRRNQINRRIDSMISSHKEIERIRVLDKNGIIIASNFEDVNLDKSETDIFLNGKNKTFAGELHFSEYTGNFVLSISSPIILDNGFAGVLIVNYHTQKFKEIVLDKTGIGETGETYLVNSENYAITPLLFVEDAELEWKVDTINSRNCKKHEVYNKEEKAHDEHHGHDAVGIFLDYRGGEVIGTHVYISEMNWCLLAEISEEEVLGKQRVLFQRVALKIIIALIIFMTFVGFFVGKHIDKRVVLKKGKKSL